MESRDGSLSDERGRGKKAETSAGEGRKAESGYDSRGRESSDDFG